MNDEFWRWKLRAFLHDPPDKAMDIMDIQKHKERARHYLTLLGSEPLPRDALWPDWAASAADRIIDFASGVQVNFAREPVLKHPLSGQDIDIGSLLATLPSLDVNLLFEDVRQVLQGMARATSPKTLFLTLWRLLPERLREQRPDVGLLWRHLPADTRVPDHSIWNRMDATAALASATWGGDHPAFLLFQVGPVQEFIATARRTQELWAGSLLLSYLSWQAIGAVGNEIGPDAILYPHLRRQPLCDRWLIAQGVALEAPDKERLLTPSLPNKFLALLPTGQAEDLARKAEAAVRQAWRQLSEAVRQFLDGKANQRGWDCLWQKQVEAHLEVYWAVLPWAGDPEAARSQHESLFGPESVRNFHDLQEQLKELAQAHSGNLVRLYPNLGDCYGLLHREVQALLDGRKQARIFTPYEGDQREKCTLCGAWEQMGPPDLARQEVRQFWRALAEDLPPGQLNREGRERLCAVCLTKRFAFEAYFREKLGVTDLPFPSTSNLAAAGFKVGVVERLSKGCIKVRQAVQAYNGAMQRLKESLADGLPSIGRSLSYLYERADRDEDGQRFIDFDGEWLFEESFTLRRIEEDYRAKVDKATLDKLLGDCRAALRRLKEAVGRSPSRYYAVLRMDGDLMGKWLAGEHEELPAVEKVLHPSASQALKSSQTGRVLLCLRPRLIGPAVHAFISSALRDFSLDIVRYIVEKRHPGRVVYSGGDDLLALLPLEHVLAAARELRAYYSGLLRKRDGRLEVDFGGQMAMIPFGEDVDRPDHLLTTMGARATASVGIALAHHLQPLEFALEAAHEMEEEAKKRYGRNAFAIAALKRSGERVETGARFWLDAHGGSLDTVKAILDLRDAFAVGSLSPRLVYQLQEEQTGLAGLPAEALIKELERLAERHALPRQNAACAREALPALADHLPLEQVIDLGLVARFIAAGGGER